MMWQLHYPWSLLNWLLRVAVLSQIIIDHDLVADFFKCHFSFATIAHTYPTNFNRRLTRHWRRAGPDEEPRAHT